MHEPREPAGTAVFEDAEVAALVGDAKAFAGFAFARRRTLLASLSPPWVAIGARWRGAPVGLALAVIDGNRAWLESIQVAAPLRRKGIAGALLRALAQHAHAAGASQIDTQYSGFVTGRPAFEALLARNGWQAPELLDIQLVGLASAMADGGGAWRPVQRAMRELPDYCVEAFKLRTPADNAALDRLLSSAPELGVPDPRGNDALDLEVSTAIRHQGALIGWVAAQVLTRSVGFGTIVGDAPSILYSGARLADGHHKAMMLVGYHRSFSRQAEVHGSRSRAVYRTHPGAAAMYNFTRARFEPMALHVEERWGACRQLRNFPDTVPPHSGHEPC